MNEKIYTRVWPRKIGILIRYLPDLMAQARRFLFFGWPFTSWLRVEKLFRSGTDFPASAMSPKQGVYLTARGSAETIAGICALLKVPASEPLSLASLETFLLRNGLAGHEERLRLAFDKFGSDKGTHHGYSALYACLIPKDLQSLADRFRVLEIGIGSNYSDTASNMGRKGKPGASLRAWRALSSNIDVVGLDIDKRILFEEEGIVTHEVDQMSAHSWRDVPKGVLSGKFTLIIDDGLHSPLANISSILHAKIFLADHGFFVIEDVSEQHLPVWHLISHFGVQGLHCQIVKLKRSYCVVLSTDNLHLGQRT